MNKHKQIYIGKEGMNYAINHEEQWMMHVRKKEREYTIQRKTKKWGESNTGERERRE